MAKLKIKLYQIKDKPVLLGWIEEQDEELRGKETIWETEMFKICSNDDFPALYEQSLSIRGEKKEYDNDAFCYTYDSLEERDRIAALIKEGVAEINGEEKKGKDTNENLIAGENIEKNTIVELKGNKVVKRKIKYSTEDQENKPHNHFEEII